MKKLLSLLLATTLMSGMALAQDAEKKMKRTPLSQEELQERALEASAGTEVERDRVERSSRDQTTHDRYGEGTFGVFQSTSDTRGLEDNDAMGVDVKLFEFE